MLVSGSGLPSTVSTFSSCAETRFPISHSPTEQLFSLSASYSRSPLAARSLSAFSPPTLSLFRSGQDSKAGLTRECHPVPLTITLHVAVELTGSCGKARDWVRTEEGRGGEVRLGIQELSWLAGGSALLKGVLFLEGGAGDSSVILCFDPSPSKAFSSSLPLPSEPTAGGDLESVSPSTLTQTPNGIL